MPPKADESPRRQQDRAPQLDRSSRDEPRSFETKAGPKQGEYDTGRAWTKDPGINTNGSER